MTIEDRIIALEKLGLLLGAIDDESLSALATRAKNENSWFTEKSVKQAINGIAGWLTVPQLTNWTRNYRFAGEKKTVATILAGNIPLVGFHDVLSVLISGHNVQIRPSSKDTVLIRWILEKLNEIEPRFQQQISFTDLLKNFDAVIATGSDNSARYFDFYFKKYPHIIRRNRSSCAILSGFETDHELHSLGGDVFSYFGLGCRNVSKLFVPVGYEFTKMFESWQNFADVLLHHKYHNNYDYQKSILLVNRVPFLDNGFVLVHENKKLVSPISVIHYEVYSDWNDLLQKITQQQDKIQCIVGNVSQANVRIGSAQSPKLDDYADQINTLAFLDSISKA